MFIFLRGVERVKIMNEDDLVSVIKEYGLVREYFFINYFNFSKVRSVVWIERLNLVVIGII